MFEPIPGSNGVISGPGGEYFKKNENGELIKYNPSEEELVTLKSKLIYKNTKELKIIMFLANLLHLNKK